VVGKTIGIGFHMLGNTVIFHDIKKKPLLELKKKGYAVTNNIEEAITKSNISFVCVPTPTVNHKQDLSHIQDATSEIGKALRGTDGFHVVVVKSTVLPFTTRTKVIPLLEQHSQRKVGKDFGICMSPEFLRQATALGDFLKPSRIVIGEYDKRSGDMLEELHTKINAPVFRTDLETAEMIKYVANTFLTTKISFFNELYEISKNLNLDSEFIAKIVSLDPRIGSYGIHGGYPFTGRCLPKDLKAFTAFAKSRNVNPKLLEAVLQVNKEISHLRREKCPSR